ncbi:MAG: twin-arginine translocation signal domain-containing protein, partial [Verrucomicrobia bacterium]|nr:twin-arginine translocation signal domain-containing protein [Verrucomicrobiota bacterium]
MNTPTAAPPPVPFHINRRQFLQSASAGFAMSALGAYGVE